MKLSNILRMKSTSFIACLFLVATPLLVFGFAGYFGVIAPLKGKLLAEQTRSLGTGIDATIVERATCLAVAVSDDKVEDFLEEGRLQEIVRSIQSRFSDFLSLELIDNSGTILAMAGDEGILPDTGASGEAVGQLMDRFPKVVKKAWAFHDDPAGEHFSVMWIRREDGTEPFFVRARFSRKSIRDLLEAASKEIDGVAGFVQVADAGARNWFDAAESGSGFPARIAKAASAPVAVTGKWFATPFRTEMRLSVPGWAVFMQGNPKDILSTPQMMWTGAFSLLALLLVTAAILPPLRALPVEAAPLPLKPDELPEPADGDQESLTAEEGAPAETEDHFASASPAPGEDPMGSPIDSDSDFETASESEVASPVSSCDSPVWEEIPDPSGEVFGAASAPSATPHDDDFLGWTPQALPHPEDSPFECSGSGATHTAFEDDPAGRDPISSPEEPTDTWKVEWATPTAAADEPSDEFKTWNNNIEAQDSIPAPEEADDEQFLVISWEEPVAGEQQDSASGPPHRT